MRAVMHLLSQKPTHAKNRPHINIVWPTGSRRDATHVSAPSALLPPLQEWWWWWWWRRWRWWVCPLLHFLHRVTHAERQGWKRHLSHAATAAAFLYSRSQVKRLLCHMTPPRFTWREQADWWKCVRFWQKKGQDDDGSVASFGADCGPNLGQQD